jgi:O-glycosyl hydrolase
MTIHEHDPNYDDTQLKAFVKWNIERNFKILNKDQSGEGRAYLETFRTSDDAVTLRAFTQEWLGQDFTKKYFKF